MRERLGLVETDGDQVRARVDLRPYTAVDGGGEVDWWIASDLGELATGQALRTDHVLGVGGASTTLAQVTVRDDREHVLDLGTGCGIQALHASRHSRRVVGTDISRRALAFARFNAALAGVTLDLREGSMLEPVADERFDLVVSNPPFVITPRTPGMPSYEYRDGGRSGDAIVRELVEGVGAVLAPGRRGAAAGQLGGAPRRAVARARRVLARRLRAGRLGGAARAAGPRAVRRDVDPRRRHDPRPRPGRVGASGTGSGWTTSRRGTSRAIGFGVVTLRKPLGAPTLRRLEEVTGTVRQPLGPAIAASLAAHDWLATIDDDLADQRLVVAPDVTEERYLTPGDPDPQVVLLRQGGGFGRAVQAGTALAGFVGVVRRRAHGRPDRQRARRAAGGRRRRGRGGRPPVGPRPGPRRPAAPDAVAQRRPDVSCERAHVRHRRGATGRPSAGTRGHARR